MEQTMPHTSAVKGVSWRKQRVRLNKVVGKVRSVNRAGRVTIGCKEGSGYVPFELRR